MPANNAYGQNGASAPSSVRARGAKFKPPVMTRRGGGKHTTHDAAWFGDVVNAVKVGTPAELKGHPVAYHGQAPHVEDVPPGPRPSSAPIEPADVPGADDMTRNLAPGNVPNAHGMRSRTVAREGGKVPATCGGSAARDPKQPC